MQKYIAKRILFLIPTIIGVTLIIYLIMNITPGDPGRAILGSGVSQADVDAYNHAIGYDLPFFQKFVNYLSNMFLHQDFGISYVTKQNVFDEIWPRYIMTLKLAFIGMILSTAIGIPLGIYAAVKQYSPMDTIGGGVIIDTAPKKHKIYDESVIEALKIKEKGELKDILEEYLISISK